MSKKAVWRCWFCGVKLVDPKSLLIPDPSCIGDADHPHYLDPKRLPYQRCRTKREGLLACLSCALRKNKRTVEEFRAMLNSHTPQGLLRHTVERLHAELAKADISDPETCEMVADIQDHLRSLEARFSPLPTIRFYGEAGDAPAYVNARHRKRGRESA